MAEETIIIRVPFPYRDERLYPKGWRSFGREYISLNHYDIQSEVLSLNHIVGELTNEFLSINDIVPYVIQTIRSLNLFEITKEIIGVNSFPEPITRDLLSLNILASENVNTILGINDIVTYEGPYSAEAHGINRLEETISFEEHTHTVKIYVDGSDVTDHIESWQITIEEDSYVNSASVVFTDWTHFTNCDPLSNIGEKRIKITLDSVDYEFLLERRALSRDPNSGNFNIWGRSYIAILDVPYAIPIVDKEVIQDENGDWYCPDDPTYVPHIWQTGDRMASEIIEDVIGAEFSLTMEITDFIVIIDTFSVSNETPIEIVNKLASVVGAHVRTNLSDEVIVRYYKYNVTGTSQVTFTDLEHILLLSERVEMPQGYNRVLVRGSKDPLLDQSTGLEIELDSDLNNDKTIFEFEDDIWFRVYKSPFTLIYSVSSSLGAIGTNSLDVSETITRESSGFSEDTLQTDKPIYSITSIERYDCTILDPSDYSFEQGYKTVISEEDIRDEPVLINYTSRYDLYRLRVSQPCDPLLFDEVIARIVAEQTL